MHPPFPLETVLQNRYRLLQLLGQGGFGRTYLAEDQNRFNELCVLKELTPAQTQPDALSKAKELFHREAKVLYQIQHAQIPQFRETFEQDQRLFLVQDYVEGRTYRALLEEYRAQGRRFSEAEVLFLLQQLLPVLAYLHSQGIVHRDISPENLIRRARDGQPVLIDFGVVKQLATQLQRPDQGLTAVGKLGYAPSEQMQTGRVYPSSDLYALAVTAVVLLSGREPPELLDDTTLTWRWQAWATTSPELAQILDRMLSSQPGERYAATNDVLQALREVPQPGLVPSSLSPAPAAPLSQVQTWAVGLPAEPNLPAAPVRAVARHSLWDRPWVVAAFCVGLALTSGLISWAVSSSVRVEAPPVPDASPSQSSSPAKPTPSPRPTPTLDPREQAYRTKLATLRQELGLGGEAHERFFIRLVDDVFCPQHPELRPCKLGTEQIDLRLQWFGTAEELLNRLKQANLSETLRVQLGNYQLKTDPERWKQAAHQLNLNSCALADLTDARFYQLFQGWVPQGRGQNLVAQYEPGLGQVWMALAYDQLAAMQANPPQVIRVRRDGGSEGSLEPGEGKIYLARLREGRTLAVELESNRATQWSVYPPVGAPGRCEESALLQDSSDPGWAGQLPQSGFYQVVVVSAAPERLDYRLKLEAQETEED